MILLVALVLIGAACPSRPKDISSENSEELNQTTPTKSQDKLQVFDRNGNPVPNNIKRKEHNIGVNSWPDPLGPITIEFPDGFDGAEIAPTADAAWIDLPDFITSGKPFEMAFNCNITDLNNHNEVAQVALDFSQYATSHPGLEHSAGTVENGTFIVVTDVCKGPCVADFPLPLMCVSDCPPISIP